MITVLNPDEESKEDVLENKDVSLEYFRVKSAEVMGLAQDYANAGKHKEATQVLDKMI
jgi:hypothetical protein